MPVIFRLPEEIEAFVKEEVSKGAAADEADFLVKAVEMYRDLKTRHDELQAHVRESIAQYERGEVRVLDTGETQAEGRRRLSKGR